MRYALLITSCLIVLPTHADAGTLNKCIEANGQVTYSNLPCKNAHETRKLEIDPPPLPDPAPKTLRVKPDRKEPKREEDTSLSPSEPRRATRQPATPLPVGKCNTLADKLGRVIDKMDAARRQGYTQTQMNEWNQQVKDIERQKQQTGCF